MHPEAVGRARAQRRRDQAGSAEQGRRRRRRAGLRVLAAAVAGLRRRPAGADGDHLDRRFRAALRRDGEDEGRGAAERAVHCRRQRSRVQPADDPGRYRPQQGQRAWRHDAGDRRHAGADARRELHQPLQPRRPLVPGDPAGAADRPAEPGGADAVLRHLGDRPAGAAVEPGDGQDDDRAERADPLQPAELGDVPGRADARGDDRPGGRFPRTAGCGRCRPGSATTICRTRGNTSPRATSWWSPSSSR